MALNVSPTAYYELTNAYAGPGFPLAVNPSSSDLELQVAAKDSSSLSWQFLTAQDASKYNICTNYQGTLYCLDIFSNEKTIPHLAIPVFVTGQQWTANPEQDNTFRLSNDYSGAGYYLDTYSDNEQTLMDAGNYSGQYWSLNDVGGDVSGASSSSSISASFVTSVSSTSPSSPTTPINTPSPSAQGGSGLSTSDKIALGVGIGIGLPTLFDWHPGLYSGDAEMGLAGDDIGGNTWRQKYLSITGSVAVLKHSAIENTWK